MSLLKEGAEMSSRRDSTWFKVAFEQIVRGALYAFTGLTLLGLLAFTGILIIIGVGGTGGFTSDPPPTHTPWGSLAIVLGVLSVLLWCLFRLHRWLRSLIDKSFDDSAQ